MIRPKVGFIVYGVHKNGLQDPMGTPFIDNQLVAKAKKALREAGLHLVLNDHVIASKAEAKPAGPGAGRRLERGPNHEKRLNAGRARVGHRLDSVARGGRKP